MTFAQFSLLAVTVSFIGLVLWVYAPRQRQRLESYGSIPLEDDGPEGNAGCDRANGDRS